METLSDMRFQTPQEFGKDNGDVYYREKDVKEFIRELKEEVGNPELLTRRFRGMKFHEIIDKLAGDRLNG